MYLEDYIIYLKIDKSYSNNTINTYLSNLKVFLSYCSIKDINLLKIEYIDILNYLTYLKEKGNYSSKSINTVISSLKSYYNFLLIEGFIKNNPTSLIKSPKNEKKLPIYLTSEEIEKLFYSIDTSNYFGKRNYLLLMLLYDTGVRVSELINIKLNNIDFANRSIKIIGKGDKERLVYFTDETLILIDDYIKNIYNKYKNQKNYLFFNKKGDSISRNEVYNIVVKCCTNAGINKIVSPHVIRHSFATHMILNDADIISVKTLLGHSNITTTQIYTHLNKKDLKKKYDELKERNDYLWNLKEYF